MNKPNTTEVSELRIFIDNDSKIYDLFVVPFIKAMIKRVKAGTYDRTKGLKNWQTVAEQGAKKYTLAYCGKDDKWNHIFSKAVRDAVADELEMHYMEEIVLGNYDSFDKPKATA